MANGPPEGLPCAWPASKYLGSSRLGFEPMSVKLQDRAAPFPQGNFFRGHPTWKAEVIPGWGPLPPSVSRGHEDMLWAGCCLCATTKEDWPAALDFPPANKSYKVPVLLGSAQWTEQPWPGSCGKAEGT